MKKLITLVLALLLVFALAACTPHEHDTTTAPSHSDKPFTAGRSESDVAGIRIQLANIYNQDEQVRLVITWMNESENSIVYGGAFEIQRLENGEWVNCALRDTSFDPPSQTLTAGGMSNKSYDITDLYDLTVPGAYRLLTSCMITQGSGMQEECAVRTYFEIN